MSQFSFSKSPPGRRGRPLVCEDLQGLQQLVAELGEREAAHRVGLTRHTLARALGGLGVYPPTAYLIHHRLAVAAGGSTEPRAPTEFPSTSR